MSQTSVYKIRIRTDSADNNGLLLLDGGELVAILMELADECHGSACGRWIIESTFGLSSAGRLETFDSAQEAALWVSRNISRHPFALDADIAELR